MRIVASCLAGTLLLLWTTAASAIPPTPSNVSRPADKVPQATSVLPDPIYVDVGGDTIATATVIPGLPYTDSGNTASYASNYESCVCHSCPYSNTGARDVVYRFTPAADVIVSVDLCASAYDTKVYIGDGGVAPVIACDDDGCPSSLYRSIIVAKSLLAGHTYYIFVDGWSSSDAGPYTLHVQPSGIGCPVLCPPGATAEGEPVCYDNYHDSYNAGCNSVPPVFTNIDSWAYPAGSDIVICGTYGGFSYNGLSYRDTDWYQIHLPVPATITWCVGGEYASTLCGIIDGNAGCPVTSFYDYNYGGCFSPICVTDNLATGTWWLWVGTLDYGPSVGCGLNYVATLSGYASGIGVAVEPANWTKVKGLFK